MVLSTRDTVRRYSSCIAGRASGTRESPARQSYSARYVRPGVDASRNSGAEKVR
ncbi:hypothetical protein [Streptomyces adustus]|uniref:hypothetical protein n=1 Tax=Streptomyces adustus TaxID=1609272 RepID=UPI0012E0056C|nr:hypothetical protein [Streptomyces adustus]